MIFSPHELVSLVCGDMTLYPGDVIACGTSLGVKTMKPDTVVEVEIDGIGTLTNYYQPGEG
jgi:2-keto-4-pentenoate hydratase/2-oxohepta-3-ene-1,7-dioic acid hydratase in catechol pathway